MKKILAFFTLATALLLTNGQNLPSEANHFIKTFFPNYTIQGVVEYTATAPSAYKVELDNNIYISFDENGAWVGIEAYEAGIPETIFSPEIARTLKEKGYNTLSTFATIEKRNGNVIVTNQDGSGYVFDLSGNFLRETAN